MRNILLLKGKMFCSLLFVTVMLSSFQSSAQLTAGDIIQGSSCVFPGNTPLLLKSTAATGGSGNYFYTWQQSSASAPAWIPNGGTGLNYQPPAPLTETVSYRLHVFDLNTLDEVNTNPFTINYVTTVLNGGTVALDVNEVCIGGSPGTIYSTSAPSGFGSTILSYQWQDSAIGGVWTNIPGTATGYYTPSSVTQKTWYRRGFSEECSGVSRYAYSNEVEVTPFSTLIAGTISPAIQYKLINTTPDLITESTPVSGGSTKYTYRWQYSFDNTTWTDVTPSANNITFQPPTSASAGIIYYHRVVKDNICLNEVPSHSVQVYFYNPLVAGAALTNSGCGFIGESTRIDGYGPISGGVAPYTYQWQKKGLSDVSFVDIPSATNWHLGVYGPLFETTDFRRKMTDAIGNIEYSSIATISIITSPLNAGTISPTNAYTCYNTSPAPINSTNSGSGFATLVDYSWEKRTASTLWQTIPGAVGGNLTLTGNITERTYYRRVLTDGCGGGSTRTAISNEVYVDAYADLIAGVFSPSSFYSPIGSSPILTEVAGTAGGSSTYTYQWQTATTSTGPWNDIVGQTNASYTISSVGSSIAYYRRLDRDVVCTTEKPATVIEVVPGTPLDGGQIYTITGCVFPGYTPERIFSVIGATGGSLPYNYSWEAKPASTLTWQTIPSATGIEYQPPIQTETVTYRRKVTDGLTLNTYSNDGTIRLLAGSVNPGTIDFETPITTSLCVNSVITVISTSAASNFGTIAQYQWQTSKDGGLTWNDIPNAIRGGKINITINGNTLIRRKFNDGCSGVFRDSYSNVLSVIGNAPLTGGCISYGSDVLCDPTLMGYIYTSPITPFLGSASSSTGGDGNYHYIWQVSTDLTTWTNILGATSLTYTSPTLNSGSTTITAYRRKVTDDCGSERYSGTAIFVKIGFKATGTLISSLKSAIDDNTIKVYPNPASGGQEITVLISEKSNSKIQASLKSIDGRSINCTISNAVEGQLKVRLPQPMAPGIYLLQVSSGTKQWIEKIVVR